MKKGKIIFLFLVSIFTFSITKNVFAEESCPPITLSYYIMFNTNGGEAVSDFSFIGAPQGYTGEALPTTTKTGYTFNGWYKETGFTTKITTTVDAQANLDFQVIKDSDNCDTGRRKATVYAKWTANTYTITLSNQEATTAGTTKIYEKYNTGYYIDSNLSNKMTTSANPITVPVRTGYTFDGYFTTANGGTKYIDSNGKLTSSASATNFAGNGTLYAHWSINGELCLPKEGGYGYTINFNTDGGKVKNNYLYYLYTI